MNPSTYTKMSRANQEQHWNWGQALAVMMDSWPQAQELVWTAGLSVDPTDLITALHDSKGKTQTLAIEALITLLNDAICHFQDQADVDNHAWQEKVTSLQVQNNELTTALTKVVTTPHHKDGSRCISEDPDKFGGTDKDITKCQQAFTIWCSQIEWCFISDAHVFISEHHHIHHIASLLKDDAYEINHKHFDTVTKSRLAGPDRNFQSRLDQTEKFRSGLRFLGLDCKTVPIIWWDQTVYGSVLKSWDQTVKQSPLFNGTRLYTVRSQNPRLDRIFWDCGTVEP